jgi:hypothetical protein
MQVIFQKGNTQDYFLKFCFQYIKQNSWFSGSPMIQMHTIGVGGRDGD